MNQNEITNDKIYLGKLLKQRRDRLNITKNKIIVISGLNYNTLKSIETGKTEYTIDSLLLYLGAIKKIQALRKMKVDKNTMQFIEFSNNFTSIQTNENDIII